MFFFYCLCYYSYPPPPSTTPSFRQSPHCYLCPWAMLICSLAIPFTFFYPVTPTPSTLTAISLFQVSMPLFLFCSLDSTYRLRSYGICLSLTGLFHLAQQCPGLSMLLQKVRVPSFLLLHSIPLGKYTTCSFKISTIPLFPKKKGQWLLHKEVSFL